MEHLRRILAVTVSAVAAVAPVVGADAHVRHLVAANPLLAAYVPVVTAVVYTLYRKYTSKQAAPPPAVAEPSAAGAPTMRAIELAKPEGAPP